MVSNRLLAPRKSLPRASASWVLDSGGFSELSLYGEWRTTPKAYVASVGRYSEEIGRLRWAAIQDWMCEPSMLRKTGKSVLEHQEATIRSYLELMSAAPNLPWLPVLQGQTPKDYLNHYGMYLRAGVAERALWGLGSVCRRQRTPEIRYLVRTLHTAGLQLHGFGVKSSALAGLSSVLVSADSRAWSFHAMKKRPAALCGTHADRLSGCANCLAYALCWRAETLARLDPSAPLFASLGWVA